MPDHNLHRLNLERQVMVWDMMNTRCCGQTWMALYLHRMQVAGRVQFQYPLPHLLNHNMKPTLMWPQTTKQKNSYSIGVHCMPQRWSTEMYDYITEAAFSSLPLKPENLSWREEDSKSKSCILKLFNFYHCKLFSTFLCSYNILLPCKSDIVKLQ